MVAVFSPFFDFEIQLAKLNRYLSDKKAVGIKLFPGHEGFYLTDERLDSVYILAQKHNVSVLFHSGWDNSEYGAADVTVKTAQRYIVMITQKGHLKRDVLKLYTLKTEQR